MFSVCPEKSPTLALISVSLVTVTTISQTDLNNIDVANYHNYFMHPKYV